jgi:type IV secretory pathway VirB2 component (pilin)
MRLFASNTTTPRVRRPRILQGKAIPVIVRRISLRPLPTASIALMAMLFPATSLAAPAGGGGGLPWESSFSKILDSIQGMAPIFATIGFLIAGVALMFGESGGMSRKIVGLVVGGAVVFGVAPLITTLFEGSSGLLF